MNTPHSDNAPRQPASSPSRPACGAEAEVQPDVVTDSAPAIDSAMPVWAFTLTSHGELLRCAAVPEPASRTVSYQDFGRCLHPLSGAAVPYLFQGEPLDRETDLLCDLLGHAPDPTVGRWFTADDSLDAQRPDQ